MKIAVETLGCRANQSDSEELALLFLEAGFDIVDQESEVDVYVLNTCSITTAAEASARKLIRRRRDSNPEATIILTGCYAQLAGDKIRESLPEIDMLIPGSEKTNIPDMLKKEFDLSGPSGINEINFRTRKFFKIQDGCQDFCSYCIVPYVRSELVSQPFNKAVREIIRLVEEDEYPEIVLTGIHLGQYGVDIKNKDATLENLVSTLADVEFSRPVRFRLSSLEPQDASRELIETVFDSDLFCNHLHLPLQSGSDAVLERMGRKYDCEEFIDKINFCRQLDPDFAVSSDIMVGFPGETRQDFEKTIEMIELAVFSDVHVFRYSRRPGTRAATFKELVPGDIASRRSKKVRELAATLQQNYGERFTGSNIEVVIETTNSQSSKGYSGYYMGTEVAGKFEPGSFVRARVKRCKDGVLFARPVRESIKCVSGN